MMSNNLIITSVQVVSSLI